MLELIWASFVSVVAPLLGTILGILGLILLTKLLKSMGIKVDQQQMDALADAARKATMAVEVWAAKKAASSDTKPTSQEKAEKAVAMVKTFLNNQGLYQLADEKIAEAIEAKLGEEAIYLDDLVKAVHTAKKASSGN